MTEWSSGTKGARMKRTILGVSVVLILSLLGTVTLSGGAGAVRPVKVKKLCRVVSNETGLARRSACPTSATNAPAPTVLPPGTTPFPSVPSTGAPWSTGPATSPTHDFNIGFGWLVYAHWTHKDVASVGWIAAVGGAGAAGQWACAGLGPWAPPCIFLFAAAAIFMVYLFDTAYNRGGGLVIEFTYWLEPWGYEYVGNNYS
jgi:hypothetical protein